MAAGKEQSKMANKRFGRLLVAGYNAEESKRLGVDIYNCVCDCHNKIVTRGNSLRSGKTKSCGCITDKINEIGNRYGRLLVIGDVHSPDKQARWLCKCDCGNEIIVRGGSLRSGHTKSCGCLAKQMVSGRNSARQGEQRPRYTGSARCGEGIVKQLEFHEHIRKRDSYTCRECNKTQDMELKEIGVRLSVHHKDENHFNNTDENAVTLCAKCHAELHNKSRAAELCVEQEQKAFDAACWAVEQEQSERTNRRD